MNADANNNNEPISIADTKMIEAFEVPLLNSDGIPRNDTWGKIWERMTKLKGKLYILPGGSVAKEFIFLYDKEISDFADGIKKSEAYICFPTLIFQKKQKYQEN